MDSLPSTTNTLPLKPSVWKRLVKFLLGGLAIVLVALGVLVSLVFIYEDDIKNRIITELNKNLLAEVKIQAKDIDVTLITSFPNCALNFRNITLMEALPIQKRDTLLYTKELSLRFNIKDIFNENYRIHQIAVNDGFCRLRINEKGQTNYNIWKDDTTSTPKQNKTLSFSLASILLQNVHLLYRNKAAKVLVKMQLEAVNFSGDFSADAFALTNKAKAFVEDVSVNGIHYIHQKNFRYTLQLIGKASNYHIQKASIYLNAMHFEANGHFAWQNKLNRLQLNYVAENLEISNLLSLLPETQQNRVKDYKSKGEFYTSGQLQFVNDSLNYEANFGVKNASITYIPKDITLTEVNLNGRLTKRGKFSTIECKNISAKHANDFIKGFWMLRDFEHPYLEVQAEVQSDLSTLLNVYPIDTITTMQGQLQGAFTLKGKLSDLQSGRSVETTLLDGQLQLNQVRLQFKNDSLAFEVPVLKFAANHNAVSIQQFQLKRGQSDLELNGELPAFLNYLFKPKQALTVKAHLNSKQLNLNDFLNSGSGNKRFEMVFPENNHFLFDANIAQFKFGKFEAKAITGNFELKNNKALLSDLSFETAEGKANADALAEQTNAGIYLSLQTKLKNLNISKVFNELNNFGQNTLTNKNVNGFLSADISFTGKWDLALNPDLNSLVAEAQLTIDRGELIDFKPLESVSRFIELNELKRIKFSTLESQIRINAQTLTFSKTELKNSALNIVFWGTHQFNNTIDYHVQLLLSELLSKRQQKNKAFDEELALIENDPDNRRSVFIAMSGNLDNPVIRYDRKGMKQKIKEDIKQEKQNLKSILKEELGWFKKDSLNTKTQKNPQAFQLEKPKPVKKEKTEPDKPEDNDF